MSMSRYDMLWSLHRNEQIPEPEWQEMLQKDDVFRVYVQQREEEISKRLQKN